MHLLPLPTGVQSCSSENYPTRALVGKINVLAVCEEQGRGLDFFWYFSVLRQKSTLISLYQERKLHCSLKAVFGFNSHFRLQGGSFSYNLRLVRFRCSASPFGFDAGLRPLLRMTQAVLPQKLLSASRVRNKAPDNEGFSL